jgi:hypothetical protein
MQYVNQFLLVTICLKFIKNVTRMFQSSSCNPYSERFELYGDLVFINLVIFARVIFFNLCENVFWKVNG